VEGDFYLDPSRPVPNAIVTHAHADHATRNSGTIYCTPGTRMLMRARYRGKIASRFVDLEYRQPVQLGRVKVTVFPAGHMLGSCQVRMEHEGTVYLYTGDFKTQADASSEPFEAVKADVLITETTFAHPDSIHPKAEVEIQKILSIDGPVLIGAYVMGKAQRITRLLSKHCPERKIYVHPEVGRFHSVYGEAGMELGDWAHYRRKEFLTTEGALCIVPPSALSRYGRAAGVHRMFATGWKKSPIPCDSVLQISDHADWKELLDVVKQVNPRQIYTLHGDGTHLKKHMESSPVEVFLLDC
jgi:putative mRNA 3-end processing factor